MKRLFPVLLLALLLFGSLQNRARAASTPPEKTASGSPGENPNKHATFNPVLTIQLQRDAAMWGEGTVLDVDVGPNLYAYVRQNPWTSFDPLGLQTGFMPSVLDPTKYRPTPYSPGFTRRFVTQGLLRLGPIGGAVGGLAIGRHPNGKPLVHSYVPSQRQGPTFRVGEGKDRHTKYLDHLDWAQNLDELNNFGEIGVVDNSAKVTAQANHGRISVYTEEGSLESNPDGGWNVTSGENLGLHASTADELMMKWKGGHKYRKRSPEDIAFLRREFNKTDRASYLKYLHGTASDSFKSRFTDEEWGIIGKGQVPKGWNVHHMKPLFRGGDNSYTNLRLMRSDFHKKYSKQLHFYDEGENPYGFNE